VLVGDYILAKGLLLNVNHENYQLLQLSGAPVKEMSEGEILQCEKA
jgi:octaprenyl-diphosphate synthase